MSIHVLRAKRAEKFAQFKTLSEKKDFKAETDQTAYDALKKEIEDLDIEIKRAIEVQELEISGAKVAPGQDGHARLSGDADETALQEFQAARQKGWNTKLYAQAKDNPWEDDAAAQRRGLDTHKGLVVGAICKLIGAGGSFYAAREIAKELYGERHPVTKALVAGVGGSGGFIVPPDYINEIIELLRPTAVVRAAGPRVMPMPRGTMTIPAQSSAASASYGSETGSIATSQPGLSDIVATYKKMTAMVPISNDLLRYADPAADALVRDDLVKVTALREDLAFLTGDGTNNSPRGYTSFANAWALANGGTQGTWSAAMNSTAASGGNFVTSTENYTLATAAAELGGLVNKLDTANVPDVKRCWFFHPRIFNYLNNVQNSLGVYVYRDELSTGKLLGYPFKKSTQIPINIWDASGANKDCSFIILAEMTDTLILDSMSLELMVSREGNYIGTDGQWHSALQEDKTLIRGIMEHDFQMRHIQSVAVGQFVRWAPAIS